MPNRSNLMTLLILSFVILSPVFSQNDYTILTSASEVHYFMEHPMHNWDAISRSASGLIGLNDDRSPKTIRVTIPVLSFNSGNDSRDSHMAEVVESYLYAEVSFISTAIRSEFSETGNETWHVSGNLIFHGVKRTINVPVTMVRSPQQLIGTGEFELKLTDYGIEPPSLLMVKTRDWMKIRFSLLAGPTKS